jgi:hypothetical protein
MQVLEAIFVEGDLIGWNNQRLASRVAGSEVARPIGGIG